VISVKILGLKYLQYIADIQRADNKKTGPELTLLIFDLWNYSFLYGFLKPSNVEFLKLKQPVQVLNIFCEQQFHQIYFRYLFENEDFIFKSQKSLSRLENPLCQQQFVSLYFLMILPIYNFSYSR